ncbi:hypothetical protein [Variovorax boronicumulans]|uniref:hypothetical protein n=1 Tax=Variovorax boronicumulans TaxID=436515 RepID=UPI0033931AAA
MSVGRATYAREPGTTGVPVRWCVILLCLLAFLGAACSDGYPKEDVPTINPSEMTRSELLEKMNSLGDQPGLDRRWRYEVSESCQLTITVTAGSVFGSSDVVVVSLENADIKMHFDDTDEKFDIRVLQTEDPAALEVSAMEGGGWAIALQMKAALENLRMHCDRPVR